MSDRVDPVADQEIRLEVADGVATVTLDAPDRRNARQVEALTINLVSVNRRYKAHAGIRVTDV